ncbi:methyltransferase domain-containing protein [Helicobacter sp. faydin-H20]|uniref:methyltransferase domain-containing protein n=1 Tax=Helicobacter anatolicus TaxID=2905874 RepID=UPI001E54F275|nr:methyltransferase domain-containing protein [Helicobacter anatolicus]MCE3036327.1 methyltransferase domain-containing protein [Helicobacter anatolicus]
MQFIANKFFSAKESYTQHAHIQKIMQDKILKLLPHNHFSHIFEFGAGTGVFTQKIIKNLTYEKLTCNDINDYAKSFAPHIQFLQFDINDISKHLDQQNFDLIISNACIQWLDQKKFFTNIQNFSPKDGILALGSFGESNLHEIATITKTSLKYLSLDHYRSLLQPQWKILHLFEEKIPLSFPTPLDAFKHLKLTGTNSLQQNFPLTKKHLQTLKEKFYNTLTYHPIYIIAKKS